MMSYEVVTEDFRDHIMIDKNAEGAIRLTALVKDPNDKYHNFPWYQTMIYYFYDLEESIERYIYTTLHELNYEFVEDCEDF
jgi:hypothetical protein